MTMALPQKSSSPMQSRTPPPTAPATPRPRSTAAMAATPRAETTPATPRPAVPVTRRPVATRRKRYRRTATLRPVLGAAAYHGLAGEVVNTMAPQTEADPVALLLQFLIYGGNAIGRGPYFQVGKDRHYTNLFGLLVGDTAKARKGLSAGHIRDFYMSAVPEWAGSCIRTGMSSGEGIIHHVRDPVLAMRKGKLQTIDPGVDDKRLLIDEREFQQALTVMQRQGNTLSTVVRDAWDCRQVLETLTKKEPTKATKPFISIGGHITRDELKESLDRTAMANGYANRFLIAFIHRSKELPLGGNDVDLTGLIEQDTRCPRRRSRG